jgi:hypothetical protein
MSSSGGPNSFASDRTAAIKRNIIKFESQDNSHPKRTYTQDNSYRLSLLQQTKDCCPVVVEEDTAIAYDIFVIMGQSNAVGQGSQATDTTPVDGVTQLGRVGNNLNKIIPAIDSLEHGYANTDGTPRHNSGNGFGVSFAKTYKTNTGRNVLLVPCARSGSSLGIWRKGAAMDNTQRAFQPLDGDQLRDTDGAVIVYPGGVINKNVSNPFQNVNLFTEALTRTLTAFNKNPNNRICGILWHQGEANSSNNADNAGYGQGLRDFISEFRNDLFINGVSNGLYVPWLFGETVPNWILTDDAGGTKSSSKALTRDAIKAVASEQNNAWVTSQAISASDIVLRPNSFISGTDIIHFNSESLIRFGVRYYNSYTTLINAGISVVNDILLSPKDASSIDVTFSSTNALVSKYVLEYYADGLLINSVELGPDSRKYTLTNINYSLSYLVNITPYYNNIKGLTSFGSYPSTATNSSGLIMRIFSSDNSTIADQMERRTITIVSTNGAVMPTVNIDHNNASRLMYQFNGGSINVGGDLPAGNYSKVFWVKLSKPQTSSPFTAGLFNTILNLNANTANWKEVFQFQSGNATQIAYPQFSGNAQPAGQNDAATVTNYAGWALGSTAIPFLRADEWIHLVGAWDNTTKTRSFFANGILVESRTYTSGTLSTDSNAGYLTGAGRTGDSIQIGTIFGGGANLALYGWMNDIRYYNRVLSPLEVRNIYLFNA